VRNNNSKESSSRQGEESSRAAYVLSGQSLVNKFSAGCGFRKAAGVRYDLPEIGR
jgi:hypothetical protein